MGVVEEGGKLGMDGIGAGGEGVLIHFLNDQYLFFIPKESLPLPPPSALSSFSPPPKDLPRPP